MVGCEGSSADNNNNNSHNRNRWAVNKVYSRKSFKGSNKTKVCSNALSSWLEHARENGKLDNCENKSIENNGIAEHSPKQETPKNSGGLSSLQNPKDEDHVNQENVEPRVNENGNSNLLMGSGLKGEFVPGLKGGFVQEILATKGGFVQEISGSKGGFVQNVSGSKGGFVQVLSGSKGEFVQDVSGSKGGFVQEVSDSKGGLTNINGHVVVRLKGCSRNQVFEIRQKLISELEQVRLTYDRIDARGSQLVSELEQVRGIYKQIEVRESQFGDSARELHSRDSARELQMQDYSCRESQFRESARESQAWDYSGRESQLRDSGRESQLRDYSARESQLRDSGRESQLRDYPGRESQLRDYSARELPVGDSARESQLRNYAVRELQLQDYAVRELQLQDCAGRELQLQEYPARKSESRDYPVKELQLPESQLKCSSRDSQMKGSVRESQLKGSGISGAVQDNNNSSFSGSQFSGNDGRFSGNDGKNNGVMSNASVGFTAITSRERPPYPLTVSMVENSHLTSVTPKQRPPPPRPLTISVLDNSHLMRETLEKEKRTPKANKLYTSSDFLLAKDKFPPVESKKSKSSKKGGSQPLASPLFPFDIHKQCVSLLGRLMKHKYGWIFNTPVDAVALGLHDYHTIIENPMDLGTVKAKLEKHMYETSVEFAEDVRLTFSNAMRYNPKGHDVHAMAEQLLHIFEEKWRTILEDQIEKKMKANNIHGLPTPHAKRPPPLQDPRKNGRSFESYGALPLLKPKLLNNHPGRIPTPKKPKAKDPNKRPMTYEEKQKLSTNLQNLPAERLELIVQIIKKRNPSLCQQDEEIEVDIDSFDIETLWELDRFVTNYKKSLSKVRKKAHLANQMKLMRMSQELAPSIDKLPPNEQVLDPLTSNYRENPEDMEVETNGKIESSSHHRNNAVEENGYASRSSSSSSSSSDSGSSSSGSDSDSGTSSGSDSEACGRGSPSAFQKASPSS